MTYGETLRVGGTMFNQQLVLIYHTKRERRIIMIIPTEILLDELWKLIPKEIIPYAYENRYYVSTWGRIFNIATQTILPQDVNYHKNKYITIHLSSPYMKQYAVQAHRICLMTFRYIKGCEELEVNHKDGVKYHNWIWNLEWVTPSQNVHHAIENNLFNLGETRENSKITNDDAKYICELISKGYSPLEIATIYPIPGCDVVKISNNIKHGLSWKHISCDYDFSKSYTRARFTDEQVHTICKYFEMNGRNHSFREVLRYLGINDLALSNKELDLYNVSISAIRKKKTFQSICNLYDY